MTTALEPDELLAEARLPLLSPDTKYGFQEFNRRAGDFAIGMVLATARLDGGVIVDAHIGVGGAEDLSRRMEAAEAALNGKPPGDDAFRAAAHAAADAVDPMEDINTSADYRRDLVRTLTRRALEHAFA
jgi:carbon-monoxide dehydrogenase medium subunit